MNIHSAQWNQLQTAFLNHRIHQSMLFVGPLHCALTDFVTQLMQLFLCEKKQSDPCLKCLDCQMAARIEHPDVQWIKPDKNGGAIKIDQIRELQNTAYLTPQRSALRLIIIEAADRMNTASANALLKILEEPAPHTIFILMAQQLSTVLPTVLSRCQIVRFSTSDDLYLNNLLMLGEKYPHDSDRALIVGQAEVLLDGLIELIEGTQHPSILVSQWVKFETNTLLWFFYLVFAQLQHLHVVKFTSTGPAHSQLMKLSSLLNPLLIFTQIDKINTLLKKISHNVNINQTLVLEDWLYTLVKS